MKAFLVVLRLELRTLLADRALFALMTVFLGFAAYALASGIGYCRELEASLRRIDRHDAALIETERRALEKREQNHEVPPESFYEPSNPGAVGIFAGRYAVAHPAPWAALSIGQTDLFPQATLVTTQSRWSIDEGTDTRNPELLLMGRFDLAFVFIVLYPLVIIALSYDILSRERECGRLALLLSQPVPPGFILGARVAARALPVLVLGIGTTIVGFLVSGRGGLGQEGLWRLVLWSLFVIGYGAFWFGCGVLINVLGRTSAGNAIALLGIWLLVVVIVPSAYDAGVEAAAPLPSRMELALASRDASRKIEARADELLGNVYRDHPDLTTGSPDAGWMLGFLPRYLAVTEGVAEAVAPVHERFESALEAGQVEAARWRFVSPALLLQSALCDLAGTGPERNALYRRALRDFQDRWRAFFLPRAFAKRRLTADDFRKLPSFDMQAETLSEIAHRTAPSLLALGSASALIFALALHRAQRLPRLVSA